jgi:16S rRNA processing protein RimM
MSDQYFSVGQLVAAFGVKGELILQHSLGDSKGLKGLGVIFLQDRASSFFPYFVEQVRIKSSDEAYLTLEGIDTREKARLLIQKEVWFREDDFKKAAGKTAPISFLGFHLIDGEEDLGEVVEVIEQPMQVLCKVIIRGKEALIPLHEETLERVDQERKRLYVTLPDGLLDIYIGEE